MYSTKNPITPKRATPSVDLKARIEINYSDFSNYLNIAYNNYGDGYPSTECFICDKKNNRLFLGAKKEIHNPGMMLPGGPDRTLISGLMNIEIDTEGNFIAIEPAKSIDAYNTNILKSFK